MRSKAIVLVGGLVFALFCGAAGDPESILRTVNDRLGKEFISHDGLLLDYVGEIPTPEEIADLKPNAMGWWCPIENGSMFTGEWLPALMAEGPSRKALVERCVRGLVKMSEISDVPGFIARGTGTDGKSHHPCGSNDQTDPWFLGLCEYCRWAHADSTLKAKALERLVVVAKALEANGWGVPCDGPFKGQDRGNLNTKKMPFWGKTRLLYSLKSLQLLTGDRHWGEVYDGLKTSALDEIESGGEVDAKAFKACYGTCVWIYLSSAQALARLIEMEESAEDRVRMQKGLSHYAERVAPLMKNRAKYANTTERPFRYANWRTGYAWRVQKTQKEAEQVAASGKREILGTRKGYERNGMANPLCAAAVCALSGKSKYRDEILATLRHYDYSTPNISEFFHAAVAAAALKAAVAAGSGRIELPGAYPGHLQDIWRADGNIWWAHTLHLVRTDEKGNVCAKVSVEGHHAGCEVKDGTLFVAVCPLQNTTGGRTTSDCRVQVNEYDAKTLAFKTGHIVTNLNDRAGSFCFLPDGTMLVGCLRHPALKKSEVKFHRLDKNFNLLETHVVDAGRDVRLGIEVIRRYDDDIFLFVYGGLVIRLDARTFEVTGRFTGCGGERGFVRDGEDAWIGVTKRNKETQSWISWLERRSGGQCSWLWRNSDVVNR